MGQIQTVRLTVKGMDCAECTETVRKSLESVAGVQSARVLLAAEKAIVELDPDRARAVDLDSAIAAAGYRLEGSDGGDAVQTGSEKAVARLGLTFAAVVLLVVLGEAFGLFESLTTAIPVWAWLILIGLAGFPVFKGVIKAALQGEVIAHSLMTLGVLAAIAVGEWSTAVIVVFFMRVGAWVESFTAERARTALQGLAQMAPEHARVVRNGQEVEVTLDEVAIGEMVIVKPGERIPVDGQVVAGQATVDASAITGESMPVEAEPGVQVFAASLLNLGSLKIRTDSVGANSTFGRALEMVEEAEANRGPVQRVADRFSGYYLPLVAAVALATYLIGRDPLAAAAVLVVACSCSFALATPIAMVASIGRGARQGLLIKGGRYLEELAKVDVLLIDKTGTLTLGQPEITGIQCFADMPETELIRLAASVERRSEHPLAQAVLQEAERQGVQLAEVDQFEVQVGSGVTGVVDGRLIRVGSPRGVAPANLPSAAEQWIGRGLTLLLVWNDQHLLGMLAAKDKLRPEVPGAIEEVRQLADLHIEILTGDNPSAAAALAQPLGVDFRAELLPEDKIEIVRQYQAQGRKVAMVGDGINDAPALAQADVGIAMGAAGTQMAMEAAHIALMRDDWSLVPEAFRLSHRTMGVVRSNLAFTALYNFVGIGLAAVGILPPIWAAAAQSLPDLGILGNSSRLLRG